MEVNWNNKEGKVYNNKEEAEKAIIMLHKMAEEMGIFVNAYNGFSYSAFYSDENGEIREAEID